MLTLLMAAMLQVAPTASTAADMAAQVAQPRVLGDLARLTSATPAAGGARATLLQAAPSATLERLEVRRRIGRTEVLLRGVGTVDASLSEPFHHDGWSRIFVNLPGADIADGAHEHGSADDGRVRAISASDAADGVRVAIDMPRLGRYGKETWGSTILIWIEEAEVVTAEVSPPASPAGRMTEPMAVSEQKAAATEDVDSASASPLVRLVGLMRLDARAVFVRVRDLVRAEPRRSALGLAALMVLLAAPVLIRMHRRRGARARRGTAADPVAVARDLCTQGAGVVEVARTAGLSRDAVTLLLFRRGAGRPAEVAASGKRCRSTVPHRAVRSSMVSTR